MAIKLCSSSFLAFTDADCVVPKNWLSQLWQGYHHFKKIHPEIAACGGANIPPDTSFFYQLLGLFLDSALGTGSSIQGRVYPTDRFVSHIPTVNILLEKKKIMEIGGFDETFGSIIEDEDLTVRLRARGYKFAYIADAAVKHSLAPSLWVWAKKMIVYGKGRMWFVRKYPEKISIKCMAPFFLAFSPVLFFLYPKIISVFWSLYLTSTFFLALAQSCKNRKYFFVFPLFFFYLLSHFLYGCGEIYGLFVKRKLSS
jgi:cellulose synthase/poly-beta-1,6-N-acetylglucosamine synthase-like glycosyltransferase